jgi:hypothetical protein
MPALPGASASNDAEDKTSNDAIYHLTPGLD